MVASGMTTFLPLVVVMVYLVLSLTSVKELELDEYLRRSEGDSCSGPGVISLESGTILVSEEGRDTEETDGNEKFFYVNAIDSIVMLVGIGNGILVSFIYLLLFIRWTNRDITWPLKELLINIRNTRGGRNGTIYHCAHQ